MHTDGQVDEEIDLLSARGGGMHGRSDMCFRPKGHRKSCCEPAEFDAIRRASAPMD